jgi:hypothetical protein
LNYFSLVLHLIFIAHNASHQRQAAGVLVAMAMPGTNVTLRQLGRVACNQRDGIGLAVECGCWAVYSNQSKYTNPLKGITTQK